MSTKPVDYKNKRSMEAIKFGFIDFTSGSLGGIALVGVGQPLDTIKVKMQTFPNIYKGMIHCLKKTLETDGIFKGLYAGTLPSVISNVAENSVLFAAYGGCQQIVAQIFGVPEVKNLSSFGNACAGFCAAFFSSLALCPTELVKCRLQALSELQDIKLNDIRYVKTINSWEMTKQIIRENGVRGLFKGLTSTIAREMPGYFFFFGGYETTRSLLARPGQSKDDIGWKKTMIAGAVGGTVLWLAIFPIDVVKSRIQVQNLETSAFIILRNIAKKEGINALYNGLMPTLIRTIPATATLFITYEYSKSALQQILIH